MIRTIKVQLNPNNKQRTKLFEYAGASRFAYNWALAKEIESLKEKKEFISGSILRKEFTELRHSSGFEWLERVSNNVTKQAIKDLCNAYKRFFDMRKKSGYKAYSNKFLEYCKRVDKVPAFYDSVGHPKFKKKKDVQRYGFYQDTGKIKFTETHVKVEGFAGGRKRNRQDLNWIRLAEKGRIPVDVKYYNPRITFDGINWWISVGIDVDSLIEYKSENVGVGIDLGIKYLAVCSDGVIYKNINKIKKVKKLEKRKRRLQRSISRKYIQNKEGGSYKKTCNIIKAEKEMLKLNHRLTAIRKDYQLQTISEIVKRKPSFICIEDLNVKGMMKNKHLARSVQQQGFREFRDKLENKTTFIGIPLVVADRWFPSSKICNCCGAIKQDLKLRDRIFKCDCDYVEDRDFNASLNLRDYGTLVLR